VGLASGDNDEYRLVRDLFVNYDKRVRPATHWSRPVNTTYGVALVQIIDVVGLTAYMYLLNENTKTMIQENVNIYQFIQVFVSFPKRKCVLFAFMALLAA